MRRVVSCEHGRSRVNGLWANVSGAPGDEDQQLGLMDAGKKWVGPFTGDQPPMAQPWNGRGPSVTLPPSRAARHPPRRATRQPWSARDPLIFIERRLLSKLRPCAKDREGNLPWRGSSLLPERMLDRT